MKPLEKRRVWWALAIAAAAGAALFFSGSITVINAEMQHAIDLCRAAGPVPFFLAMTLLPLVGFPLSPFTLSVGPVFGQTLGLGTVIGFSILAVTINVALSYAISAHLLHPAAMRFVQWLGCRLPEISQKSAWMTTLAVRIVPGPPFFLQSYLLGLVRVPFGIYMCVSTLVPLGYLVGIILVGDALARGDRWTAAAAVALVLAIGGVIHFLRKRFFPPAKTRAPRAGT